MRADVLGCYGGPLDVTPRIDGVAQRGCRFERAFTVTAQCAPARASLLSGLYPAQHGVQCNGMHLDPRRAAGHWFSPTHTTAWLGHWHLGHDRPRFGFEHNLYIRGGTDCAVDADEYRRWLREHGHDLAGYPYCPDETFQGGAGPSRLPAETFLGSFLADRAITMLEQFAARREPFVMVVSDFAPHPPFAPARPYDALFDPARIALPAHRQADGDAPAVQDHWRETMRAKYGDLSDAGLRRMWAHYLGLCRLVDDNVGRLDDALRRLELASSTAVAVLSDHGEMLGSHGLMHKGPCFYDAQMRVPLIMAGPGVPAGGSIGEAVSLVDVMPTLAELAGVRAPSGLAGRSLAPLWRGAGPAAPATWDRDTVFAEYHSQQNTPAPMRAAFTSRWKYHWHPRDRDELFDIETDPGERHNRATDPQCRARRDRLRARLIAWMRSVGDPLTPDIANA